MALGLTGLKNGGLSMATFDGEGRSLLISHATYACFLSGLTPTL